MFFKNMSDSSLVQNPKEKGQESSHEGDITLPVVRLSNCDTAPPVTPCNPELKMSPPVIVKTKPLNLSSPISLPTSPTHFSKLTKQQSSSSSQLSQPMNGGANLNTGSATGNPRNKCELKPGHSLMDWIRLGNSGKDLTGFGGRMRPVTLDELAKHNSSKDAWMAIRGHVYNITYYMDFHPGGKDELMRGAGKDATKLVEEVHPWVNYKSLLSKCFIGPLITDMPTSEELFGSSQSLKSDRLSEPTKDLVRKSMENLSSCKTPAKKKTSKDDTQKPSKIMQKLIQSSDLPVSISRSAVSSNSLVPSNLRFDWIQTSTKLTLSVYTGALSNPAVCVELKETLRIDVYCNNCVRTLELHPEAKLQGPVTLKVYSESGKIEVTSHKTTPSLWKGCGTVNNECSKVNAPWKMLFKVVSVQSVTYDTTCVCLERDEGPVAIPIGHHVRVHCQVDDAEQVRPYTPIGVGWSASGAEVQLCVKRYPKGPVSSRLVALCEGDPLSLTGPYGQFQLTKLKRVKRIYLIAAGTGITPMLGLIKFMLARTNPRCERVSLLFFNKKESDILFRDHFETLSKEDNRFNATHILSDPEPSWSGLTGRITQEILTSTIKENQYVIDSERDHFVCVCGPTGFTQNAIDLLLKIGFKDDFIHPFVE